MRKPQTTPTQPESSSEIDWDLLDQLDGDQANDLQDSQELQIQQAVGGAPPGNPEEPAPTSQQALTVEEMDAAGLPVSLRPLVPYYDSLQELMAEYPNAK